MSRRLVFPIVNILIVRFPNYPVWLYENWKADFEYFYVFIDSVNFFPSYPFSIELLPFSIDLCPFSMLHIIPFSLDTDPASCLIPSLNPTVFFSLSLFLWILYCSQFVTVTCRPVILTMLYNPFWLPYLHKYSPMTTSSVQGKWQPLCFDLWNPWQYFEGTYFLWIRKYRIVE